MTVLTNVAWCKWDRQVNVETWELGGCWPSSRSSCKGIRTASQALDASQGFTMFHCSVEPWRLKKLKKCAKNRIERALRKMQTWHNKNRWQNVPCDSTSGLRCHHQRSQTCWEAVLGTGPPSETETGHWQAWKVFASPKTKLWRTHCGEPLKPRSKFFFLVRSGNETRLDVNWMFHLVTNS